MTSPVEPIVIEHAELAQAVYDPSKQQVGDWSRLSDADLKNARIDLDLVQDDIVGYKVAIYQKKLRDKYHSLRKKAAEPERLKKILKDIHLLRICGRQLRWGDINGNHS